MKLQEDDSVSREEIDSLVKGYAFLPFSDYGLDKSRLERFTCTNIVHELECGARAITARATMGELLLLLTFSKLDWDSSHFGIPLWAIQYILGRKEAGHLAEMKRRAVAATLRILGEERAIHVSAKVDFRDIPTVHALEMEGFRLMDTTVTYAFDFRKKQIPEVKDQCSLRLATSDDQEVLLRIAATSFSGTRISDDRFHADPDLPRERSDALYVEWIRNSTSGRNADGIIVAEIDGEPVGFTTMQKVRARRDDVGVNVGALILSAVQPQVRKRNVYTSMIRKGLEYLASEADIVELGTQISNLPVQKAWTTLGFRLASGTYALHRTLART